MPTPTKPCTCHKDGTCNCLGVSAQDGRGQPYCKVCGETEPHCDHGCVCGGEAPSPADPNAYERQRSPFLSAILGEETHKTRGLVCPKCLKTSPPSAWGNRPQCPECGWR